MVCFGGLEFIAAGYLIAEHSKKKKKEQARIEEEEALRQQAALQSSHHHHHRRRRRHSDSEREDRRHREKAWMQPAPKKERREKDSGRKPSPPRDKRRDELQHYRPAPNALGPRHGSPLAQKPHMNRPYPSNASSMALTPYLAPPQQPHHLTRAGSDPPPSRVPAHNSIFPPVPYPLPSAPQNFNPSHYNNRSPQMLPSTASSRPQAGARPPYPTYNPPSPPAAPLPASALSSRPPYTTPPQANLVPWTPPPEGVWELPAGEYLHPNPARQRASSTSSRHHVHFADGLDVHGNISTTDPPPPYREY